MILLPVVSRELAVQARRRSTYRMRASVAALACVIAFIMIGVTSASLPPNQQGKLLFSGLSVLAVVYCSLVGPLVTADSLSAGKRDGTVGILFLTDLNGYDIIFGKLFSSSMQAAYGVQTVVPLMSFALLFGGITPGGVARTALVLSNTLFFSLAAGMLVSTIS